MTEQAINILTVVTGLIAIFVSLITAVGATRKSAFDDLRDVVREVKEQNDKLSKRVDCLEKEISAKNREIKKRDEMINDLKDWAEALVAQVKSVNLVPVSFKRRRDDND